MHVQLRMHRVLQRHAGGSLTKPENKARSEAVLCGSQVHHLRNDTGNDRACQTWLVKWLALVIYKREAVGLQYAVWHRWFAPLMPGCRGVAPGRLTMRLKEVLVRVACLSCVLGSLAEDIRDGLRDHLIEFEFSHV
ncbi:MAG: hypothetical protein RIS70_3824 [Planctomycetota bacterium]